MNADGPYLRTALLCERVLTEKDDVLSIVRMIDKYIVTAEGKDAPRDFPAAMVAPVLVMSLVAGTAKGRFDVAIRPEKPSGEQMPTQEVTVTFDGRPNHIVNLIVNMQLQVDQEGLWWVDVLFEGQVVSRVALDIAYQRITPAS